MTKKEYQKPAMQVVEIDTYAQILTGSVKNVWTTGLGDGLGDGLNRGDTGNMGNALGRRHSNCWYDEEDW